MHHVCLQKQAWMLPHPHGNHWHRSSQSDFTMAGVALIDKLGRKTLMIIGSIGYIVSLFLVSSAFYNNAFNGVEWFVFLFIAAHAIGQGAVIWVYISEIFPTSPEARAVFWYRSTLGGASIITLIMPYVLNRFQGGPIFLFLVL